MSLLIYSEKESSRLHYILDFIFNEAIPCDYSFTTDTEVFNKSTGAKINYSAFKLDTSFQIIPHPLLYENDLKQQKISTFTWQEHTAFFKTSDELVSFDVFSAIFYLITRYEEYLEQATDEFGRFPHEYSLAFRENFIQLPLVDHWLISFKELLQKVYPTLKFRKKEFQFLPSYDIDIAYSFKHKGFLRNTGGLLKDLFQGKTKAVQQRIAVLSNKAPDPFNSFDFLAKLHKKYKLDPTYFFLLGSGGKLDKNISPENNTFQQLIQTIATQNKIGIHPSYRSNDESKEFELELERLQKITGSNVFRSRQHYIKFSLPSTYRKLIAYGITEEYSMGYGSINGFRASTSHSFSWFDLSQNESTELKIFPFCFMECNSFFEQKQSLARTQIEIKAYIEAVKNVNGTFISIWHNFSLGTDPLWKDWSKLYEYQIGLALK